MGARVRWCWQSIRELGGGGAAAPLGGCGAFGKLGRPLQERPNDARDGPVPIPSRRVWREAVNDMDCDGIRLVEMLLQGASRTEPH